MYSHKYSIYKTVSVILPVQRDKRVLPTYLRFHVQHKGSTRIQEYVQSAPQKQIDKFVRSPQFCPAPHAIGRSKAIHF